MSHILVGLVSLIFIILFFWFVIAGDSIGKKKPKPIRIPAIKQSGFTIAWRAMNILITGILITMVCYRFVQADKAAPQVRELEKMESKLFKLLMETDPQRETYDAYLKEEARLEREIRALEKEWDEIPQGTVIGRRRQNGPVEYTGAAKSIQDELAVLRSKDYPRSKLRGI